MKWSLIFWFIWMGLILFLALSPKKWIKLKRTIIIIMFVAFFAPLLLPRQVFGRWNSISKLKGKTIAKIVLQPSEPDWKVNLTGKDFIISNKKQIDTIIDLLQNVEVYFPGHPSRIWETKMIFIGSSKDSFEIKIHQTENNGTVIYTPSNEWRKDAIGPYLEKIISYRKPVYSDTSTTPRSGVSLAPQ